MSGPDPGGGAWLPGHVAGRLPRLAIRRASAWRVLLAVVAAGARREDRVAPLGVDDLVRLTGLSDRSVKGALAELRAAGLVARVAPRRLAVPMLGEPAGGPPPEPPTFTPRQEHAVSRALRESGRLLLTDAAALPMPPGDAARIGLAEGVTFGEALESLRGTTDRARGRLFVGMVLAFRHSERVGGTPIE